MLLPAQYPAWRPVIGPIPMGPVASPLGMMKILLSNFVHLFTNHCRAALRTFYLHAGHATLMWLAMITLRA
jgi:hypothetical protein